MNQLLVLPAEVHIDQNLVRLRHAILQARRHVQLVALHRQHERRLHHQRNLDVVEVHQAPQRGRDDGARSGQANLARDVGVVSDGKVLIVERHAGGAAIVDEPLDGGFDQPDAAVVAVQGDIARQVVDAAKPGAVLFGQHDLDGVPLVEDHLRREIAHDQRDRPAVVPVGGIAHERGPRVRALPDDDHRRSRSTNARSDGPCLGSASANSTKARKYASKLPMSNRRSS